MEKFISNVFEIKVKSMRAVLDEVEKSSGNLTRRLYIDYPQAVAVIPFIKPNKFVIVKQYRYAVKRQTIEFPAGKIDLNETPEQAAFRELQEETGFTSKNLTKLTRYIPAMGYSTEILHMFFATDLEKTIYKVDSDEISNVEIVSKEFLLEIIKNKENLIDPKILIGFLLAEKLQLF
jgi:ADP-ribose pyrophosphatase